MSTQTANRQKETTLRQAMRRIDQAVAEPLDESVLRALLISVDRWAEVLRRQAAPATPGCVVFDPLPLGSVYTAGAAFTEGAVVMKVGPFQWLNGIWTWNGYAEVDGGGAAGGSGQDLRLNNATVSFDFGGPVTAIKCALGEYGGNINLEVNGALWNFDDFSKLPGTSLGGVSVTSTVTPTTFPTGEIGSLVLAGTITSFSIGGQELWIDDVCYS
jgi:hypothetical protein